MNGDKETKSLKIKKDVHKKLAVFCVQNEVSMIEQASLYIEAGLKGICLGGRLLKNRLYGRSL